jgi:TetR/AcrR family transcriptional repressor of nem operon
LASHGIEGGWSAESLAAHTQVVIQGAFILAKARNDVNVAIEAVDHLRRYVELLFARNKKKEKR